MKGFTGFYRYGHPCFIREDYEAVHAGETELQRLLFRSIWRSPAFREIGLLAMAFGFLATVMGGKR